MLDFLDKLKHGMVWSCYTTVLGIECIGISWCRVLIPELGGLDGFDFLGSSAVVVDSCFTL
jgi:hypothetical protein